MHRIYDIDLFDGHLIISEAGKTLLLDTGSPISLADSPIFEFMGEEFHSQCIADGFDIHNISEQLGKDIDVLVGIDVLEKFLLKTDYQRYILDVDTEFNPNETDGEAIHIKKSALGVFDLPLKVDGQTLDFALDTGAKISYINSRMTSSESPIEERADFYPMFGFFTTPVFEKDVRIGDMHFSCLFGNLPGMIEMPLSMIGSDGIISFDLFNNFKVTLDFKNTVIYLTPNATDCRLTQQDR